MKKVLQKIDSAVGFVFTHIGGCYIAATFLIVLYTVFCRYVINTNTGGIDEFTTYLVTCSVWFGAVLCSRNLDEGQISIDFLAVIIKSKKAITCINMLWQLIAVVVQGIFTKLSFDYFANQLKRGATLSGLDFPIWVFTGIMTLSSAFIVIYELRKMIVQGASLFKDEKEDE